MPKSTAELPLAQHAMPSNLDKSAYEAVNRARKASATAYELLISHRGTLTRTDITSLSREQIDLAAGRAGVEAPTSHGTYAMVRELLRVYSGVPRIRTTPTAPVSTLDGDALALLLIAGLVHPL
ncbi:hypothetical protein AB0J01_28205 [Streptomyces sp. NPDC050204]|uniref:hypothetical protein n=1 Tax=Streptomyces sp. NPDC050204 TaxID=3155514 RepID=UPI003431A1E3